MKDGGSLPNLNVEPRPKQIKNISQTKNKNKGNFPLIHTFLKKHVTVKLHDDLKVEGILTSYQLASKTKHLPYILCLVNESRFHIIRGSWISIQEAK
jgi:hypothetical protein